MQPLESENIRVIQGRAHIEQPEPFLRTTPWSGFNASAAWASDSHRFEAGASRCSMLVISWGRNAFPVTGVAKEHASCKSFAFIYKQPYHRERERERAGLGEVGQRGKLGQIHHNPCTRGGAATPRGGGDAAKNAQPQPAKTDLAGGAKTAYT